MKLYVLLFLAFFTGMATTNATVYTVSNDPNNPAQFDNLADAHDAANPGDTIYIFGSSTSYGIVFITKQLTIVGAGYNPDNQHGFPTKLLYVHLRGDASGKSSGTKIMGIEAFKISNYNSSYEIDDITIQFCYSAVSLDYSSPPGKNWMVKNNIIKNSLNGEGGQNIIFSNNIILGNFWEYSQPSILILNNLFIGDGNAFSAMQHPTFNNNIFYGKDVSGTSCIAEFCTFNNNLSYLGDFTTFITGECGNAGSANLENTDPQFMSVASTTFSYDDDYRLQSGSPCINAGTDGTDIGITGGEYPWPRKADGSLDLTGMPPIPQIIEMYVSNPVVPENGTLKVKVKAHQ